MLQFASLSFDMSAEEIYMSLTNGAALVMRTDDMISSPQDFAQFCGDKRVSILDLPTAYWHELTDALADDNLKMPENVRLVIIGGEKASADRFAAWRQSLGDRIRLINTYGPTETTIACTMWDMNSRDGNRSGAVPIGRPTANTPVYVLDKTLRPVPIGVAANVCNDRCPARSAANGSSPPVVAPSVSTSSRGVARTCRGSSPRSTRCSPAWT